jgi:predicted nucleotidyltransferase
LFEHYQVSTIDELERLCLDQKLRVLPRMGAKLEEKVLKSIAQYRQRTGRYLLSYAEDMARELTGYLGETPGIEQITLAGSLRRGRETVGDLDLLVTGPAAADVLERFVRFPRVEQLLARGENKASATVGREGLQVDVRALPRESFGAALQYFTGSKDHNVAVRTRAVKMGFKLSEYGLYRSADETKVAGETEAGVYEALGLGWIPPELRENLGEIERAAEGRLPELVELAQIRGDVHMHTTESDGRASLEEMAAAARERGYEYIAVTDHSKSLAMTNGLDEKRVVAFAAASEGTQPRRSARGTLRAAWHPPLFRPRVRHLQGRHTGPRPRRAGRAGPGHRQRTQPHEHGIRGDDGPAAAGARVPAGARVRPPHQAASCCTAIRFPSISNAWRRRPCAAACGSKLTPAPSGWICTAQT